MIFTFYSFKGGVGRSMALANIAEVFLRRGLRVLVVDFDLEAPGIERYLVDSRPGFDIERALDRPGLIDLLYSYRELREFASSPQANLPPDPTLEQRIAQLPVEPLNKFIVPVHEQHPSGGSLSLIASGRRAGERFKEYADKVLSFRWEEFFKRSDGELFFEWLRKEAAANVDVVLIDSRTGVTEMSGVCTHLLADAVVSFVAANRQNLEGSFRISDSLTRRNSLKQLPGDRKIQQLLVPSRVELNEGAQLDKFRSDFKSLFGAILPETSGPSNRDPFVDLQVPYIPFYAFLERLAVCHPEDSLAHLLVEPYERLATAMARLAPVESALFQAYADPVQYWVKTAENVVGRIPADQLDGVRRILTRLVAVGRPADGVPDAQIRVPLTAFDSQSAPLLEQLTATQLISRNIDPAKSNAEYLELPQKALISSWPLLKQWIDSDRDFLLRRREMSAILEKWEATGETSDLLSGSLLQQCRQWLQQRPDDFNEREKRFLAESIRFDTESRQEKEQLRSSAVSAEQRATRLVRRFVIPASILILLLAGAVLAWLPEDARLNVLIGLHLRPEMWKRPWLDDILLQDGQWKTAGKWKCPPEWLAVPGANAVSNPEDGALLVRGTSLGTPDFGSAALYDFAVQFDIVFLSGTHAAWMFRAQNDRKQGYVFELEQQPPLGFALRGWAQLADGSRQPLRSLVVTVPLQCCAAGDTYRVSARVQRYSFRHVVSLVNSRSHSSATTSPEISAEDEHSRYRSGNVGFLELDFSSVMKIEYLYIQPIVLQ